MLCYFDNFDSQADRNEKELSGVGVCRLSGKGVLGLVCEVLILWKEIRSGKKRYEGDCDCLL